MRSLLVCSAMRRLESSWASACRWRSSFFNAFNAVTVLLFSWFPFWLVTTSRSYFCFQAETSLLFLSRRFCSLVASCRAEVRRFSRV